MSEKPYSISKTSFIKLEQCHKAFFLYKNHPYLRDKLTTDRQLTFKRGHDVGFYARQLFPGGVDVWEPSQNHTQAMKMTAELIAAKAPVIYEATFVHNNVLVMADILVLEDDKYNVFEIKSSLKVSETYLKDAYLQYYVIKNVLPALDDLFLVTLNPDYRLEGEPDPRKMFKRRSVKQKAAANFPYFEHRVSEAMSMLEQNTIPNIAVGRQCFRPYQCDFFGACWKDTIGEKSIFNLPLIDKTTLFEWHGQGIKTIDEVDDSLIEKQHLRAIKRAIQDNTTIVNREKIAAFTGSLQRPFLAMDMEIWNPAIPQLQGTGPFDQIPFLVCFYNGQDYFNFFAEHKTDQRQELAAYLATVHKDYSTVLVYDKTLEVNVIESLLRRFPEYSEGLGALKAKIRDVFEVFLNVYYYNPAFKSNFTLKGVSGIVLGEGVSYQVIGSGLEAMSYFDRFRNAENPIEKEQLKQELVDYCNTDCYATYHLAEFFENLVASS